MRSYVFAIVETVIEHINHQKHCESQCSIDSLKSVFLQISWATSKSVNSSRFCFWFKLGGNASHHTFKEQDGEFSERMPRKYKSNLFAHFIFDDAQDEY